MLLAQAEGRAPVCCLTADCSLAGDECRLSGSQLPLRAVCPTLSTSLGHALGEVNPAILSLSPFPFVQLLLSHCVIPELLAIIPKGLGEGGTGCGSKIS